MKMTWMMFKNHYGRDLPLPTKEKITFSDRRVALKYTERTGALHPQTRNPWLRRRDRVTAYPLEHYFLLAGAILIVMGLLYFLVL